MNDKFDNNKPLLYNFIDQLNYYRQLNAASQLSDTHLFNEKYLPLIEQNESIVFSNKPFLSVIVRSQGKRFETLKETFLCLSAQTDQDFEVILIIHKADQAGKEDIDRLINMQASDFRNKIKVRELSYGSRTTPLNYGVASAKGQYFAVLDDDDIVFDHWIENFHSAAAKHSNCVLRCFGLSQFWSKSTENATIFAEGPLNPQFCSSFSLVDHLSDNHTPISCAAYPTVFFQKYGICFDETLTTAEDWDYFMRCVLLFGIYDTKQITFLYRIWNNSESSHTVHQQKEWLANKEKIINKFKQIPVVSPYESFIKYPTITKSFFDRYFEAPQLLRSGLKSSLIQIKTVIFQHLSFKINQKKYIKMIKESELFDSEWYSKHYFNWKEPQMGAAKHYLCYGWTNSFDPSEEFSTKEYLLLNPDILSQKICPLLHYELFGRKENREYKL